MDQSAFQNISFSNSCHVQNNKNSILIPQSFMNQCFYVSEHRRTIHKSHG